MTTAIAQVLKRKDAASVLVAIIVAMTVLQALPALAGRPAGLLLGLEDGQYISYSFPGATWVATYVQPILVAALELLIVEIGIRLYVFVTGAFKKN